MPRRSWLAAVLILAALAVAMVAVARGQTPAPACTRLALPVVVNLDDVKHAHLIAHEREAIAKGQPRTLTLERDNAAGRRAQDLRGIPTRPGFDRDEWPIAASEEAGLHSDGSRADVAYVASAENRSGGAALAHAFAHGGVDGGPLCDGQRLIVEAGTP
jgi:hypothetical protein